MNFKKLLKITIPALFFCVVFSVSAFCAGSFTIPFRPITPPNTPLAIGSYFILPRQSGSSFVSTTSFGNYVFNYNVPSTLSGTMSSPIALEYRSDIVIGSPYGGYSGYMVFDTYDVRNVPSILEDQVYYGIDVLGYNPVPDDMTAGLSIFDGGYYSFNLNIGCSFDGDFSLARFSKLICVPVFGIYNKNFDPVTSNPPLYFIYGDGSVDGVWLGDENGFWDNDSTYYFDSFSFDFVLDGSSCISSLSNLIDLSAYGDVFFAGFRFAICSDVLDFNEKPFVAFPNLVGGARLSADEYSNILIQKQIDQNNKNTEEVIGVINTPIDNTPIADFDNIEGSAGDVATDKVDDVLDWFGENGNILSENTPLYNAFLFIGSQFNFIFGAHIYTLWIFMFVLVIILIGVVARRGIFSSATSAVVRFRNSNNHARVVRERSARVRRYRMRRK